MHLSASTVTIPLGCFSVAPTGQTLAQAGIRALVAEQWYEAVSRVRVGSDLRLDYLAPKDAGAGAILLLASNSAGVTADASL